MVPSLYMYFMFWQVPFWAFTSSAVNVWLVPLFFMHVQVFLHPVIVNDSSDNNDNNMIV